MPIAAVPNYMQQDDPEFYLSAPPGHRFLLYFPVWGENQDTGQIDWRVKDRVPKIDKKTGNQKTGKYGPEWEDLSNKQYACNIAAGRAPVFDPERPRKRKPKSDAGLKPWRHLMEELRARQSVLAESLSAQNVVKLSAIAIAPFTTGLGNEHPLENGFAFLWPYGLPYLPGSGVKGVLRQAARELARGEWGETHGWSEEKTYMIQVGKERIALSVIDVLFGLESGDGEKEHVRGALSFWDVIPQIAGDSLMVEVMTPHQSHYYQQARESRSGGSTTPHDSGQPNPIFFLTVPPRSGFTFHVVCDTAHLTRLTARKCDDAPDLLAAGVDGEPRWKALVTAAFEHAFEWLGFGAKTAVGYGAMAKPEAETSGKAGTTSVRGAEAVKKATREVAQPRTQEITWPAAKLVFIPGTGEIKASFEGRTTAGLKGQEADALRAALGERASKLKKDRELKNVAVRVRIEGNMITLLGLTVPEQ